MTTCCTASIDLQAALPCWITDAAGVTTAHPDVPAGLPALAGTQDKDTALECAGRVWRVRVRRVGDAVAGCALPIF